MLSSWSQWVPDDSKPGSFRFDVSVHWGAGIKAACSTPKPRLRELKGLMEPIRVGEESYTLPIIPPGILASWLDPKTSPETSRL